MQIIADSRTDCCLMNPENIFFTPSELALYLQIPISSVYGWRYGGYGPRSHKVGRHVRYRKTDVDIWLESCVDRQGPGDLAK